MAGRRVTVVDTPGWRDYCIDMSKDSPTLLKEEIVQSVNLCPPGPHAILLVIRVNAAFTEAERNAVSNHMTLLGPEAWKHALVLFVQESPVLEEPPEARKRMLQWIADRSKSRCSTLPSLFGHGTGKAPVTALSQGKPANRPFRVKGRMLQWLVEACGNRYHVLNINNQDVTQVTTLINKLEEVVALNNGLHFEVASERLLGVEDKRRADQERSTRRRGTRPRRGEILAYKVFNQ